MRARARGERGTVGKMGVVMMGSGVRERLWGGGGGGMAHLEGEAVVFVHEEVRAGEGDVVVELRAVLVDVVAVWCQDRSVLDAESSFPLAETQRTGEHILFELLAPFLKLLH